jgi:peptidoglycan/LPS O-acetylase OafA/YrhL
MVDYPTIFSHPLAFQVILPFLLVFTLVFAVLTKSEVLGKGKNQINAIVALVIGLIVISFGYAVYIINNLIPFMAVSLIIILVFMILVGAVYEQGAFKIHDNVKWAFMGIIAVAVTVAVLYFTGAWDYLYEVFYDGTSNILINLIFIALIIAVIAVVLIGGKDKSGDKK